MRNSTKLLLQMVILLMVAISFSATAQDSTKSEKKFWGFFKLPPVLKNPTMQFFRPYDKTGVNVFEPTKDDTTPFDGIKIKIGASLSADFQALTDRNNATPVMAAGVNSNQLMRLTNGFNLPMANLNLDAQLADGIRMELTVYLASRHHQDTWVKGGYIQIDKLPFFKSELLDNIMKAFTLKLGQDDVDYGDAHFRRADGGNSMYDPFIENYIMDEFATEMGGELYFHPKNIPVIAMLGITNGELNPTVTASTMVDSATGKLNKYAPAFHAKLGIDKQWPNLRVRLTGSVYADKSANMNTMFFGDRTGSRYYFVIENTAATSDGNAWSGRIDPGFDEQVKTFMVNPFIKFHGLELFATYEMAWGRMITEKTDREVTQGAVDLVYRFPEKKENFWIGGRFNEVTGALLMNPNTITIYRGVGSVGWFVTKNIMAKVEYVYQQYNNFASTDIRSGARFGGVMLEGAVGF